MRYSSLLAAVLLAIFCFFPVSCTKYEEFSLDELEGFSAEGIEELLAKTVSKPWQGEEFAPGKIGGTWYSNMSDDPKSFNHLIAEQDSATAGVIGAMTDELLVYDYVKREWKENLASAEIEVDNENNSLMVIYTLRDDLYWSYHDSSEMIKVTSDDIVFWYNEISGDPKCGSSSLYQQFLTMPDGSEARVTITRIDDLRFSFNFPRIIAEPLLSTNMDFGPRFVYEPAKQKGGAEAVKDLFSISVDPKTIPSIGQWHLIEYNPGQRLVYKRNPNYWKKDANGVSIPYTEEMIVRIIKEENTQMLLFMNGEIGSYRLRPDDIDALVNKGNDSYTVFNAEGGLTANFWTFNQNPVNSKKPYYDWFLQKEFRQAMSCLLNRERINLQVYRGLAEPKINLFPEPNKFYNPDLTVKYLYNPEKAIELLASIGITQDKRGVMRDSKNRKIEFDLCIRTDAKVIQDQALIIRDELSKIGIKINIRVLDFQKQVQQLFTTFDWETMIMGLSGSQIFPSQGSNVWRSQGNLHLWYPNQESPVTDWEARIDYLYNEGLFKIDTNEAQIIWDEFQSIILEQMPMIYLMRSRGFWALNNRWDFTNAYFDNMGHSYVTGSKPEHLYLK